MSFLNDVKRALSRKIEAQPEINNRTNYSRLEVSSFALFCYLSPLECALWVIFPEVGSATEPVVGILAELERGRRSGVVRLFANHNRDRQGQTPSPTFAWISQRFCVGLVPTLVGLHRRPSTIGALSRYPSLHGW